MNRSPNKKIKRGKSASPSVSTAMANLPGEEWKEVPGFEDEYLVSNYGRVKSQDRWRDMGTYDAFHKGRIRKLHIIQNRGKDSNGLLYTEVYITLHKHGERYRFAIPRLIYNLFVTSFD